MNTTAQYLIVIFIYLIAYVYSIELAPYINGWAPYNSDMKKWNDFHEKCWFQSKTAAPYIKKVRGPNYYLGKDADAEETEKARSCLLTTWNAGHFLIYSLIGFVAPNLFWPTFAIGAGFEIYEKYEFGCEDGLDILYNTLGFGFGKLINKIIA